MRCLVCISNILSTIGVLMMKSFVCQNAYIRSCLKYLLTRHRFNKINDRGEKKLAGNCYRVCNNA